MKKRNISIIMAIFMIILVLVMWWIKSTTGEEEKGNKVGFDLVGPTTTPTIIPVIANGYGPDASGAAELQREATETLKSYPLFEKLPYVKEGVKISHYYKPLTLAVYVNEEKTTKDEAWMIVQEFLKANNYSPTSHEVDWRTEGE